MPRTTRRQFLKAGTALAGAAAISGCSSVPLVGSGGSALSRVPEDAEFVATANVEAMLADDGVEELANAYFSLQAESDYYEGPEDMEDALDQYEDELGLDPRSVTTIISFGEYGGEQRYGVAGAVDQSYAGMIVESDWSTDDVEDALEEGGMEFTEDDYEDKTVFEPEYEDNVWVGVLEEGTFVFGTQDAMEDAIDATTGDDDGIDADLKGAYDESREGLARFASEVPEKQIPQEVPTGDGDRMDAEPLTDVDTTYGSLYGDGDTRGMALNMIADDEDTAEDINDILKGGLALLERQAESTGEDAMVDLLDKFEVSADGSTVAVTFEATIDELTDGLESMA